MASYPILVEGLSPAELRESARNYVMTQSSNDDSVLRLISKHSNRSYQEALLDLGKEYNRYDEKDNTTLRGHTLEAIGYFQLVHELEQRQSNGGFQYEVTSWADLNRAGRARAFELISSERKLADAPDSATEKAAQNIIANDPAYRDQVAAALDAFISARPNASPNAIRNALDMEKFNNSGLLNSMGQNVESFFNSKATQKQLVSDMRSTYEFIVSGKLPAVTPSMGNPFISSAQAATPVAAPAATASLRTLSAEETGAIRRRAIAETSPGDVAAADAAILKLVETARTELKAGDGVATFAELTRFMEAGIAKAKAENNASQARGFELGLAAVRREQELTAEARRQPASAPAGSDAAAPANGTGAVSDSVVRAQTYGYRDQAAPAQSEIPVLAQNQVEAMQQTLVAAGLDIGKTGADRNGVDGKYGPNTHKALRDFAATLNPKIEDLTTIDFTTVDAQGVYSNPQAQRLMDALAAAGQATAPAAPAVIPAIVALRTELGTALTNAAGQSAEAVNCLTLAREEAERKYGPFAAGATQDQLCNGIRTNLENTLRAAGVNPEKLAGIMQGVTIEQDGTMRSEAIRALETALGFTNADDRLDARGSALLDDPASQQIVARAFNNGIVTIGRG